jgi:ABC-2 type transport system permease protein
MGKAVLVAMREYVENLRTKTFWIGIFIFPVLMTLGLVVPQLLSDKVDIRDYVVVDESGDMLAAVENRAAFPDLAKVMREARRLDKKGEDLQLFPPDIVAIIEYTRDFPEKDFELSVKACVLSYDPNAENKEILALVRSRNPSVDIDIARVKVTDGIRSWWRGLDPEEAKKFGSSLDRSRYRRIVPEDLGDDPEATLNGMVDSGEIFAWIKIGKDPVNDGSGCKYVSNNQTDYSLRKWFERLANDEILERRFKAEEIDKARYKEILKPVTFTELKVGEAGQEVTVGAADKVRQWVPVGFAYMLWIAVFTVAQMLLTNTVEEKSNRLIEVLLSSVSPLQLMGGKIAGIAATGLTITVSWVLFLFLGVKFGPALLGSPLEIDISFIFRDPVYVSSFLAYFVMGYLFYAAFLVGLGSVCNSLKEAQNLMQPVMIIMIVPLLAIIPVAQDPNGNLATFLSYVPPFTPFIMMNRSAGPPPAAEYVITSLLLLASVALALLGAAKVFRIGILMTGKRPTLREILRWLGRSQGSVQTP